jgi:ectoine hydroxylase-related dioxygenase (phytanoyl-CoA dioxygenase family)
MTEDGFRIHEGALPESDCSALASVLGDRTAGRAGARHLMKHPAVAAVATRPELLRLARDWAGPGAVPYRATLFEKSGERNWLVVWHQDTTLPLTSRVESAEWGPWSTKEDILYAHAPTWALENIVALRIHLDPSTPENGPLNVVPGSHRHGVLSDDQVFEVARRSAARPILVGKGGVLAMRPLLIHASSKARGPAPRRVLHVEYAPSWELRSGLRLAKA